MGGTGSTYGEARRGDGSSYGEARRGDGSSYGGGKTTRMAMEKPAETDAAKQKHAFTSMKESSALI